MNKKNIKEILRGSNVIKEAEDSQKPSASEYERVENLLNADIINHSAVIRKLWGTSNATNRSLFGKKLKRENNDSGGQYSFDKEEISKIMSFMMNFSNQIKTSLKPSDKE